MLPWSRRRIIVGAWPLSRSWLAQFILQKVRNLNRLRSRFDRLALAFHHNTISNRDIRQFCWLSLWKLYRNQGNTNIVSCERSTGVLWAKWTDDSATEMDAISHQKVCDIARTKTKKKQLSEETKAKLLSHVCVQTALHEGIGGSRNTLSAAKVNTPRKWRKTKISRGGNTERAQKHGTWKHEGRPCHAT